MGHKYVPWALRVDGISRNARYLLVVMTELAWNSTATLDISLERLAVTAHYSKKSTGAVWKLVQELVAAGLISKRGKADGSGNQIQNTYTVHWKEWGERSDTVSQEKPPTSTAQGGASSQEKRHHLSGEEAPPLMRRGTSSQERNVTRDQVLPGTQEGADGDSFQEWIELFPSSKRKNLRDARAKYTETINSGTTHRDLIEGTRAYLDRENSRTDGGAGGTFISQALKVLEDGKWKAPTLSTAEAIKEAGGIDRRMRDLRDAGDDDGATALFHAELAPLIEKHDLIRDEWGIGFRKRPKPFSPAEWSMS